MRRAWFAVFLACLCAPLWGQPRADTAKKILIDRNTVLCVAADEPAPVMHAVDDLASDMTKVFGVRPKVVHRLQDAHATTLVIGSLPGDGAPNGISEKPESFSIEAEPAASAGTPPVTVVRLSGADMRGTMYAIYQFSQQFLGVDPMYYWTDNVPTRRTSIALSAHLHQAYPAPVFRYRGFFINDEDLLTGWAPGEAKDKTGISLAVWNKVFETILRLKGNMVVPGTWTFPDEPQDRLAAARGLLLSQHHAEPLGVNVARWPKGVPYNFTTHPEILERAWKDAVAAYPPDQQILWGVGLRGLSDQSYAALDPAVRGNDKALGHLISKAIADQIRIVHATHPDARFVTDLWQEGAKLMQQGDLTIPANVITVWADTGYGYIQDDGQVRAGQGAYYHVAMMNNAANQLTEMVPVERIFSEMGRYQRAKATSFFLLNTSDLRPVTMTARAAMDFAWSGASMGSSDEYYHAWATEEFGAKSAPELTALYKQYFAAAARQESSGREYGDQLYHTEARQMMLSTMLQSPLSYVPDQAPKWEPPHLLSSSFNPDWAQETAKKEIQACGDAQPRWDAVWKRAVEDEALITPVRRPFYHSEVLTMIAINRESNRMLLSLSQAVMDLKSGDRAGAAAKLAQALEATDAIKQAEATAEYGKWKNWYHGDWLTGVDRTHQMLQVFARWANNPSAPILPPIIWNDWEAYYHIMHYEGNRAADVQ